VVGPEPMVRARLCTPRRAASCRLASPRVASCRPASRRLGLARPRKVSPVTFNFRAPFEKPLSLSLSLSLSLALFLSLIPSFTTPPTANWVADRVPPSAVPCREQPPLPSLPIDNERLWPRKSFPFYPWTFERRRPAKLNRDSLRNRSYCTFSL